MPFKYNHLLLFYWVIALGSLVTAHFLSAAGLPVRTVTTVGSVALMVNFLVMLCLAPSLRWSVALSMLLGHLAGISVVLSQLTNQLYGPTAAWSFGFDLLALVVCLTVMLWTERATRISLLAVGPALAALATALAVGFGLRRPLLALAGLCVFLLLLERLAHYWPGFTTALRDPKNPE